MHSFRLTSVLFAIALIFAPGTASSQPSGNSVITADDLAPAYTAQAGRKAAASAAADRFDQARDILLKGGKSVSSDHPLHARFLLAWSCYMTADWLCVESVTDGLERKLPQFSDYIDLMQAASLSGLKNDRGALARLERIPATTPLRRDLLKLKAGILVSLGREFDAATIIKSLVDQKDADAGLISELTEALMSSSSRDRAIAELKNIYYKSSSSGRGGFRGLLRKLGVVSAPSQDETMDRAWTQLNAHANEKALKTIEPLLSETDPARRCEALEIAGRACSKLRRHKEAVGHFSEVIKDCRKHRDMPPVLYTAIRSAWRSGDQARGDSWALMLATDYPDATYNDDIQVVRARTAIEQGRQHEALKIIDESLRRWPNGDMASESRWLAAWGFITAARYPDALKRLEEAIPAAGRDPSWGPRFSYWKARVMQLSGRARDARAAFSQCVIDWPMSFYSVLALGRLTEGTKKAPEQALAEILADPALKPGSRGNTFLTIGDVGPEHPAARAVWLSRAGLPQLAANELKMSAVRDDATDWLRALMTDKSGDFTPSHRLARDLLARNPFWPDEKSAGYYRLAYPRPFEKEVRAASAEAGIDPLLVWAVMREESAFVAGIESWANAIGLMQLIMPTAKTVANQLKIPVSRERLRNPAINTRLGARYLGSLLGKFGNPVVAIPGYNAGGGAIARWLKAMGDVQVDTFVESIPAWEAREYARKVFESFAAYSYLYGQQPYRIVKVDFRTAKRDSGRR
ncbi:MAG TPA: transglycosylase SLT domain-containing protein [Myxococcota bacterium]|nr:transglycosylase SLT domain-containing protein [Myxococcota bacterium]